MNALELIEQVREHDAELVLEDKKLVVRGRGERLPPDLRAALREHKADIMVALGADYDATVAEIIHELRPHLPKALQALPDAKILVLVNWSIMHGLAKSASQFRIPND